MNTAVLAQPGASDATMRRTHSGSGESLSAVSDAEAASAVSSPARSSKRSKHSVAAAPPRHSVSFTDSEPLQSGVNHEPSPVVVLASVEGETLPAAAAVAIASLFDAPPHRINGLHEQKRGVGQEHAAVHDEEDAGDEAMEDAAHDQQSESESHDQAEHESQLEQDNERASQSSSPLSLSDDDDEANGANGRSTATSARLAPSLRRLAVSFADPEGFRVRMCSTWASLRELMPRVKDELAAKRAEREERERRAMDELNFAPEELIMPLPPMPAPTPDQTSARPSDAQHAADAGANAAPAASAAPAQRPSLATAGRSFIRRPSRVHRRAPRRQRSASCPPALLRASVRVSAPKWLQALTTPKICPEPATDASPTGSSGSVLPNLDAMFHTSSLAAAPSVLSVARPLLERSVTQLPIGSLSVPASAPTTPGVSWPRVGLTSPLVSGATFVSAARHVPLLSPLAPPAPTSTPTKQPAASAASTPASTGAAAAAPSAAAPVVDQQGFAVPPPRTPSTLLSPRTTSGSTSAASSAASAAQAVSQAGTRPTPLMLPSSSPLAGMSPLAGGRMLGPRSASPSVAGAAPSSATAAAAALPPMPRPSLPQFGDSVLVHSIESATSVKSESRAALSPLARPPLPPSPMSPLARGSASVVSAAQSVPLPSNASLSEWRVLSLALVEGTLHPPTSIQVANGERKSRAELVAAITQFSAALALADEASTATGAKGGSMPPPMSPLPSRRASLGALPPLPGGPTSPRPGSMMRAVSERSQPSLPPIPGSPVGAVSPASAGSMPPPLSPNISRMSSLLHSHPPSSASAPRTPHVVPMSPLAMPAFERQATLKLGAEGAATSDAAAAVTASASTTLAAPPAPAPSTPAASLAHPSSRVGDGFQAVPTPLLSARERLWERAAYLRAHAAVHGFPPARELPPLPSPPAAGSVAGDKFLPIPAPFPPPHALPSFPPSASLALVSKRSALRQQITGSRRAARRKDRDRAGHGGEGRLSLATLLAAGSLPARPPPGFNLAVIWPWTWDELREREAAYTARRGRGAGVGRDARKRARVATRDEDAAEAEYPFFEQPSRFPPDSVYAHTRFDDDALSPYFACSAFVRPPTSDVHALRPGSPVHVLSVPPSPAFPSGLSAPPLRRLPSSLLDPASFQRRAAALERGEADADALDEEEEFEEEDDRRDEARLRKLDRRSGLRRRAAGAVSASPDCGELDDDEVADRVRALTRELSQDRPGPLSPPHRPARSMRPAPRHASSASALARSPSPSPGPPCSSPSPRRSVSPSQARGGSPARGAGAREVMRSGGGGADRSVIRRSMPPLPPPPRSLGLGFDPQSSKAGSPPAPSSSSTANKSKSSRPLGLADLSPPVRISSARSGMARLMLSIGVDEGALDERMARLVAKWRENIDQDIQM